MSQPTCAEESFEQYRQPTRRERFPAEMEQVIPWSELAAVVELYYPKAEEAGCPPVGIERMLRLHFLQHWFNLSDPAAALYDSRAMRQFVGIARAANPCRMRRPSVNFGISWKPIGWASNSLP